MVSRARVSQIVKSLRNKGEIPEKPSPPPTPKKRTRRRISAPRPLTEPSKQITHGDLLDELCTKLLSHPKYQQRMLDACKVLTHHKKANHKDRKTLRVFALLLQHFDDHFHIYQNHTMFVQNSTLVEESGINEASLTHMITRLIDLKLIKKWNKLRMVNGQYRNSRYFELPVLTTDFELETPNERYERYFTYTRKGDK